MTIEKPQPGAPGISEQSPRREGPEATRPRGYLPAEDDPDALGKANAGKTKDDEPESDEERIRREQATTPALMPIGDPAGAS